MRISLLILGMAVAVPVWANGSPAAPATGDAVSATAGNGGLAQALEQAWLRHPEALALQARAAEAQAGAEVAASLTPEPMDVSLGVLTDRPDKNHGKREWEVELAVPLWLPGQQAAHQAQARGRIDAVAARAAALRLGLAGELREAWWELAATRNARDSAQRRLDTAQVLAADVQRRFRAGELARVDANLAQDERLSAQAELLEAQAEVRKAEQAFAALTGAPAPLNLQEEPAASAPPPDSHPQLAAAAAAARAARATVRAAEAARRDAPEFAVRMVRERGEFSEPFANAVGVSLKIPFSSGARVRHETSAALAEAAQAEAELALARLKQGLAAERARAELAAAEQQLAMAQSRRALTADTLALTEKSFALGEVDLLTLLRVRAAAYEAESFLDRQRAALGAARSSLNQTLGVLP